MIEAGIAAICPILFLVGFPLLLVILTHEHPHE